MDRRLADLERDLRSLPELHTGSNGSRYGFRSEVITDENEPHWIEIDLGALRTIDAIAAFPVHLPTVAVPGDGFGFPRRFKVEVSDQPGMREAKVVVDRTGVDFANPGRYPVLFEIEPVEARYVRFTSTRHVSTGKGYFWALEELMVLSGDTNLAVDRPRSASSELELFPNWSIHRINDGMCRIGMPLTGEASPSDGYLSASSSRAKAPKWLTIDLGDVLPLEEIRLFPVHSDDPRVVGGRGFPREYVVELAIDAGFGERTWNSGSRRVTLGYPFGTWVSLQVNGARGRYLRLRTRELFARKGQHRLALAEVEAYVGGRNVALGKSVEVVDTAPSSQRWSPAFLVDGYTSRSRFGSLRKHLGGLAERGALEQEHKSLQERRDEKVQVVAASATVGIGGVGGVAVVGWVWMLVRRRVVRRQVTSRLREQIARDLHDDIGSNLAGIVLLSEVGTMHAGADEEIVRDFREIRDAAEVTSESMRDIVWLIRVGNSTLRDLLIKMRDVVEKNLGDLAVTIETEPSDFRNCDLSLLVRRHVLLSFKETLHNVWKHAEASHVSVRFEIRTTTFRFTVMDDGCGFDLDTAGDPGHGLDNMKRRAERVNGDCRISSAPGAGTTVEFSASLGTKR